MAGQSNNFENVLIQIYSKYITLPEDEVRRNNVILNTVLNQLIDEMKKDSRFSAYYNRPFYGGSYFDGLRVGRPEEFDLDLLLKLPKDGNRVLDHTNLPGYLFLQYTQPDKLSEDFKTKFLDAKHYLSSDKVRILMQSIVSKALNKFKAPSGNYIFRTPPYELRGRLSQSGPAITLKLSGEGIQLDVDLVPCFEFSSDSWPKGGYRENPVPSKSTFFIVPKKPKNINPPERYWRLSFQEQERELLNGKRTLKPTLKLIKMLRDATQHTAIASYYIKTIFLWEQEQHGDSFWDGTLTETFFKMLDKYIEYIESGKIPYFWNKKNNLMIINQNTLDNMKNRLRYIQKDILAKYKTDPLIICDYLHAPLTEYSDDDEDDRNNTLQTRDNGMGVGTGLLIGAGAVAVAGIAYLGTLLFSKHRNNR